MKLHFIQQSLKVLVLRIHTWHSFWSTAIETCLDLVLSCLKCGGHKADLSCGKFVLISERYVLGFSLLVN